MKVNINTDALVKFTNKLEAMAKTSLPMAVMRTLNDAAFDVKKNTMPRKAEEKFTIRQSNFFKANSKVEMAKPGKIDTMKSTVGFFENNARFNNYAVRELEQQEQGGIIKKRKFIPLTPARKGGNNTPIKPNARLGKIKNIVKTKDVKGKTAKEKFIKAAIIAGKGGYVLSGKKKILFRIDSVLSTNLKSKKTSLKVTPIYKYNSKGTIKVDNSSFMEEAALISGKDLEMFFIKNAKKIIK